jgi:hypothetical protein
MRTRFSHFPHPVSQGGTLPSQSMRVREAALPGVATTPPLWACNGLVASLLPGTEPCAAMLLPGFVAAMTILPPAEPRVCDARAWVSVFLVLSVDLCV